MSTAEPVSVHLLRSRWKPSKDRLLAQQRDHPTHVRFHRACSWLQRVEKLPPDEDLDLALMCQWIAFNALYGQWDAKLNEPMADRQCWRNFNDRLLKIDRSGRIAGVLVEHRKLVMAILDDEFLAGFFWKDPSPRKARQATRAKFDARTWYQQQQWSLLLERLLERVHLLRCQLVHGAATFSGRLNRKSLRRCTTMMNHLLPAMMLVLIEHGADEDWGHMCYPPLGAHLL